jgi:NDP-sugar pyrophosphorylase family protein
MVGGSGLRLRPFTYVIPKPLLSLGDNTTILENMVQTLSKNGFTEIFLMTSYQHKKFNQCKKYENKYGVKINICHEEEKMGTIGGVISLKDQLDNNFLVLNGDLVVKIDFRDIFNYHRGNDADITIGVTEYRYKLPYSVVEFNRNNELTNITEKPAYPFIINSGIYVLSTSIFELLEKTDYMDMPGLISIAKERNKKIMKFDIGDCWLDMGHLDDYEKAIEVIEEWNKDHPTCARPDR